MKTKKLFSSVLALFLCASMLACGSGETVATKATDAPDSTASESPAADGDLEDTAQIEVMFWTLNTIPTDLEAVQAAINAITIEKINTEVHLNIIEMGNYIQQVNLMISGNEKLDLMVTLPGGSAHFNSMTAQNQLLDITDLLNEYAPELMALVPQSWLAGTTIDGKIYSVTSYGDKVSPINFICRTDILEETGIAPSDIKNFNDVENVLAEVAKIHPELSPVAAGSKKILGGTYFIGEDGEMITYDTLGDGDNAIIGLLESDGTTIKNNYIREEYIATCERLKKWYDNGWLYKDGANYSETAEALISGNVAFSYFAGAPLDAAAAKSAACGHDMTLIPMEENPILNTGVFRKFSWAVPVTATEPEAAVKFMNLLYSDAEIVNLINWGIEGEHYQVLEDGSIDFLEGQNAGNCGYYIGDATAILGNGFLARVRSGQAPDFRKRSEQANLAAIVSEYNGFSFDSTGYENHIAAITNTVEEYRPSLACGLFTQEYYDEFIAKLESNGINEYIAHIQSQLDAWIGK